MSIPSQRFRPHPLLREPVLYAVDIPEAVKWEHLDPILKVCGQVVWLVQSRTGGLPPDGTITWKLQFQSLYHAEMALATVQSLQIPGISPPCLLTISPTLTLVGILPPKPIVVLYVKPSFSGPHTSLQAASAQQLFEYFRPAGPLALVHTDIDVGAERRTCAVEYWDLDDAQYAVNQRHSLHSALQRVPGYTLCPVYPYGVLCTNLGSIRKADLLAALGPMNGEGSDFVIDMRQEGTLTTHCYISFKYRTVAALLLSMMNGEVLDDSSGLRASVRYIEIGDEGKPMLAEPNPVVQDMRLKPSEALMPNTTPAAGAKSSNPPNHTEQGQTESQSSARQAPAQDPVRQEEIDEMTRRMQEMNRQEEQDRKAKEQEAAEKHRQDAERAAREERERHARPEPAPRKPPASPAPPPVDPAQLEAYRAAAAREHARCTARDAALAPWFAAWTPARLVRWFAAVSPEFDATRFDAAQPLTFASVPWPLLVPPAQRALGGVEWQAVEAFFAAARAELGDEEYREMLEKAHRRFHPDKWRARGLLRTVLDEELRRSLEDAGNTVAQAITPLWLAAKSSN
ncbi:hypothetical protein PsYK624_087470 [Phanerochaete sordida]|uniref:Uncharacterized protein n=1 Tax=Phanerochaete sordida TaxID=48140 RepID=A0A9P3LG10_9APHY|nr:hypothetical protein PsYK624_087470 [Phanerochaete sordida]